MSDDNLRDYRENRSKKSGISPSNLNSFLSNKECNSIPSGRFYTEKEEVTLRFYQTPKALFKNSKYKGLSLGSKLMYSIMRDRLDLSIKNNWKDGRGFIYLVFSVEELSKILDAGIRTIIRYKKSLNKYKLILEKKMGQGKPNRIYILKPELSNNRKCQYGISRNAKNTPLEVPEMHPSDTNVNETNLNNVNRTNSEKVVENSGEEIKKYPGLKRYRSEEKKQLAKEITEELEDEHSLGAFRIIVDKISEQRIRIFLSIIKDTLLTGRIKRNRGAMFISLAKTYAVKNNINLNFRWY